MTETTEKERAQRFIQDIQNGVSMPAHPLSKTTNRKLSEKRKAQIVKAMIFADNVLALKDPHTFLMNYWLENEARNAKA